MRWFTKDTSNRCCNGGTEHDFQPRYDERERNTNGLSIKNVDTAAEMKQLITIYTYVKDVCTWCGKEVKR